MTFLGYSGQQMVAMSWMNTWKRGSGVNYCWQLQKLKSTTLRMEQFGYCGCKCVAHQDQQIATNNPNQLDPS
jgi:hypothetical protein